MYQNYVELSNQPPRYEIRSRPDGMATVDLYDEVQQLPGEDAQRWRAAVYSVETPGTPGLTGRVYNNFDAWLAHAKQLAAAEQAQQAQRLPDSERFAQIESAIMELAELATGGEA